jgi:antitoxin CptB
MRELDALLTSLLDSHWRSSDNTMRSAFAALLEAEDDELWDWLLGRTSPSQANLKLIVDEIRGAAPSKL